MIACVFRTGARFDFVDGALAASYGGHARYTVAHRDNVSHVGSIPKAQFPPALWSGRSPPLASLGRATDGSFACHATGTERDDAKR